jgi:shikimate dehydrogenase
MHNCALDSLGISAVYVPLPCQEKEHLSALLPAFHTEAFLGANVTTPHKQNIIPLLDSLDESAQNIGAVNTICKTPTGTLIGKNSDAKGFLNALTEADISYKSRSVFILGAGGAARAIAHALAPHTSSITIANRSEDKAQKLLTQLRETYTNIVFSFCSDPSSYIPPSNLLLVQCTSLGNNGELPPHPPIHKQMSVVDLLYTQTPLLQKSASRGAQTQDGTAMLVHQAALSFSWWFHTPPPLEIMRTTILKQRSLA